MNDLISKQAAIDAHCELCEDKGFCGDVCPDVEVFRLIPSAQPTLYGYDIEHLGLIASVLQKENLPPEMVADALMDIGRIVAIVRDEFEETLRKAVIDALERKKDKNAKRDIGGFYNIIIQNDIDVLKKLPSAQPERKKGEWLEIEIMPKAYDIMGVRTWASVMKCDTCGFETFAIEGHMAQYHFCPSCGARMDGESDD